MTSASAAGASAPISSIPACGICRSGANRLPGRAGIGRHRTVAGAGARRQTDRGNAGDLRRHVGPQDHHAMAVGIHDPEILVGNRGAGTAREKVLEFEQRRLDAQVGMRQRTRPLPPARPAGPLAFRFGVGRQQVAQAGKAAARGVRGFHRTFGGGRIRNRGAEKPGGFYGGPPARICPG